MFIYIITNDVNDKAYVGLYAGKRLRSRWTEHLWHAANDERVPPLYRAIRKHGAGKFHITSVWSGHISRLGLADLERYYIKSFQTRSPNGYNVTDGGDGSIGYRHSEEAKNKLRGRTISEQTREKQRRFHRSKSLSISHRRAIGLKMKGNTHLLGHIPSVETRLKLSLARKGKKTKSPSKEVRDKISASLKRYFSKKAQP